MRAELARAPPASPPGVFALYAHTIMPGLRTTDDRTFVAAFSALDRAIINPWFMAGGFVGALVCTSLAVVANLHRPPLPWVVAALALYLVAFVVTLAVHVPLNDAIKAAGGVGGIHDPRGRARAVSLHPVDQLETTCAWRPRSARSAAWPGHWSSTDARPRDAADARADRGPPSSVSVSDHLGQ
ncbi:MAG: anthrone oxygenase family protein, partial [Solirubrobacteraceae bacterium]